jgi:hypothetical protein
MQIKKGCISEPIALELCLDSNGFAVKPPRIGDKLANGRVNDLV